MFEIAILIGVYSYFIFFLGIAGLLFKDVVLFSSLIYITAIVFFCRSKIKTVTVFKDKTSLFLSLLILVQILINFIGVLGPEISFDALWYHLTLPKLYIIGHGIFHIPGNLLFYSDMPKLTEMLFVPSLMFGNETIAKFIHFTFGILILIAAYKISKKFLSTKMSLFVLVIFYSNLVVGWETISAYIDLTRTFFEVMTFWGFLNWIDKKQNKWLVISGIMMGLTISAKVLALESMLIFFMLFAYVIFTEKQRLRDFIKNFSVFALITVLVPFPWFTFSYLNTGNIFYPFFDKRIDIGTSFIIPNLGNFLKDLTNLLIYSNDPISPIYLIALPLIIIFFKKTKKEFKIIYIYSFLGLLLWYLTPKIGGGRFILPYLPVFSVLAVYSINTLNNVKLRKFLLLIIILTSFTSIGYRALANKKYVPVVFGKETKTGFLTKNLNFSFGDFYDTDNYFKNNIKFKDKILLYGFHNLYYIDFPFIDSSWVKKGDKFNYIAVQNSVLPEKFNNWKKIYYNPITKVTVYSLGGKQWVY